MAPTAQKKSQRTDPVTDKRAAILRAAIDVFARNGYCKSKVSDVAKEARVADGTVYLYFKCKDEILRSVFDQAMGQFIAEGKRELVQIHAPQDRLKKIAELHLGRLSSDRNLAIVFQVELRGSIKHMQEFSAAGFSEYLDIIRKTISDGQQAGVFRRDIKPIVAAKIIYGALDEMVTNWVLSEKHYPLEPLAIEVLKVFSGGIRTK